MPVPKIRRPIIEYEANKNIDRTLDRIDNWQGIGHDNLI